VVTYFCGAGGREDPVAVEARPDGRFAVMYRGRTYVADLRPVGGGAIHALLVGARSTEVAASFDRGHWRLDLEGRTFVARVETELEHAARVVDATSGAHRAAEVRASMPGFITRVLVAEGDQVTRGTPLLIIEAMKMENEILAEHAGVVAEVAVSERQTVNNGDVLVRIS
jgi:biotin carboxyl carrier protein